MRVRSPAAPCTMTRDADLGGPDELSPRARDAPGDREAARARPRRSRSPRATSPRPWNCASASGSRTPRSAATGAAGSAPRLEVSPNARWRWPLGARPALRPSARARLQRHHDRGRAPAHPVRDDVRLRVGHRPAQRQLPAGQGRGGPRRDPARAPLSLRRPGQDPRLPGPQGGVLPGRLRARPGGPRRPRPRPECADRGGPDAAGGLALSPLRERPVRRRAGAAGRRADGRAPPHAGAARELDAAAASSSPSAR